MAVRFRRAFEAAEKGEDRFAMRVDRCKVDDAVNAVWLRDPGAAKAGLG